MNYQKISSKDTSSDSIIISFFICLLIILVLLQISEQLIHWFLLPVALSGILIGTDAINWLRGRLNTFDPIGLLGLFGFHFFFLAPLLNVSLDYWLEPWYVPPSDWRPWLGCMAIFNLLGILVYRFARGNSLYLSEREPKNSKSWKINQKRTLPIICFALIFSAVLQISIYQSFGGLENYISAATDLSTKNAGSQFAGMGFLFMFSESFPVLAMIGFAIYSQKHKNLRSWPVLLIALVIFFILQILFGGLRGNRSNTLWGLFWALGIIHFWIRPISKKGIVSALVVIFFFLYLYSFFKEAGLKGIEIAIIGSQEERINFQENTGRTWESVVLDDLGRASIQAFLLYRIMRYNSDYEFAWGRTYFADVSILVPKSIWPKKPPDKYLDGIRAESGLLPEQYDPNDWISSKVYGLAGESMLNFGPFSIPFFFIVPGIITRVVRCYVFSWKFPDSRLLILPLLINLCFLCLMNDLDIIIFFIVKNGVFPGLILFAVSDREINMVKPNT
ncbi:hypothetical protein [Nostoc sp. NMS8]|uniref:hypothetical protein n=1 Tax=Nostoc sp. NMS8 TaxID=2815392 RepID=UPI0025EC9007|nr:hypothetical protein [Nostoc sp. NMS8]MBN3960627.1 hypothetical protein [Nostoc sp. NMS8]